VITERLCFYTKRNFYWLEHEILRRESFPTDFEALVFPSEDSEWGRPPYVVTGNCNFSYLRSRRGEMAPLCVEFLPLRGIKLTAPELQGDSCLRPSKGSRAVASGEGQIICLESGSPIQLLSHADLTARPTVEEDGFIAGFFRPRTGGMLLRGFLNGEPIRGEAPFDNDTYPLDLFSLRGYLAAVSLLKGQTQTMGSRLDIRTWELA
jgi:hypothetical protein